MTVIYNLQNKSQCISEYQMVKYEKKSVAVHLADGFPRNTYLDTVENKVLDS